MNNRKLRYFLAGCLSAGLAAGALPRGAMPTHGLPPGMPARGLPPGARLQGGCGGRSIPSKPSISPNVHGAMQRALASRQAPPPSRMAAVPPVLSRPNAPPLVSHFVGNATRPSLPMRGADPAAIRPMPQRPAGTSSFIKMTGASHGNARHWAPLNAVH